MWDPYAEFESATLPNGLTVYAAHWPNRPWETMEFLIHTGARHDPIGLEGITHFVEHLVSNNTPLGTQGILGLFEGHGGSACLGQTGYGFTSYDFFAPTDHALLKQALSIFGDMLLTSTLKEMIERERQVILREFRKNFPVQTQIDLVTRRHHAIYADCWFARYLCPLGDPASIARITPTDLQTHYDTHYTPANMSIIALGGMTLSEIVRLLSESPFATEKSGSRTPLPQPAHEVPPPSETRYVYELSTHLVQPNQHCAYQSYARIPGTISSHAIHITKDMLLTILFEELREKRMWTYSIQASWENFVDFREFTFSCKEFSIEALGAIEGVINDCIASVGTRQKLFDQTKRKRLAQVSLSDMTGRGVRNGAASKLIHTQRIASLAEKMRNIESVTMDNVRHVLEFLVPERRWTMIIRP